MIKQMYRVEFVVVVSVLDAAKELFKEEHISIEGNTFALVRVTFDEVTAFEDMVGVQGRKIALRY